MFPAWYRVGRCQVQQPRGSRFRLKDVYSHAITTEKRELFNAEIKYRVEALSEAIGLEPGFISGVVLAELNLFRQIDHLEKLLYQVNNLTDSNESNELKDIAVELDFSIRSKLSQEYGINLDNGVKVSAAKDILISKLCTEYGVRPDEARRVKALAKISRDMQDAMSGERVNPTSFIRARAVSGWHMRWYWTRAHWHSGEYL